MAGSYVYSGIEQKYRYIADVFDTLVLRDIVQKYKIKYADLLDNISEFMMDNISNLSSGRNITEALIKGHRNIDHKTVKKYIDYLCNAYAFYRVKRYDIRGKKYLASNSKYYLCDHSFRYAKLGTKNPDYGRILENIVAIELLRRGYEIYVGVLYKKEVDFVAIKRNEQVYIQVANSIEDTDTFNREIDPLLKIRDAYPKMIITRTGYEAYQHDGVQIVDIADWLLS